MALPKLEVPVAVWGLEAGFEAGDLAVLSEQAILGDRLVRPKRKSKRPQDFLTEVAALTPGDLVVHVDHGIGRFEGLQTIEAAGAPHDCLTLGYAGGDRLFLPVENIELLTRYGSEEAEVQLDRLGGCARPGGKASMEARIRQAAGAPHDCLTLGYAGGDRLFLPVENIELLTRYGSEEAEVQLDRLGGGAWQARKSRMKQRIREMAGALMKIAAARIMKEAPRLALPEGLYDEFAARFPYEETEDQQNAIEIGRAHV